MCAYTKIFYFFSTQNPNPNHSLSLTRQLRHLRGRRLEIFGYADPPQPPRAHRSHGIGEIGGLYSHSSPHLHSPDMAMCRRTMRLQRTTEKGFSTRERAGLDSEARFSVRGRVWYQRKDLLSEKLLS